MNEDLYSLLFGTLQSYGYLGAFLIAVFGSVIPFLPVPYLAPIVLMSGTLDPFFLGIIAGIGGALGKLTSYALGRFGRKLLTEERRERMNALGKAIGKYGAFAVFLFALTPLPDDIIYIPVGLTGFNLAKFMIANALGKIVLSWTVAYMGRFYFDVAVLFLGGEGGVVAVVGAIIAMAIITIVLLRINWEKVIEAAKKGGVRGAVKAMIDSVWVKK